MTMFSVYVEVTDSPLAEAGVVHEDDVAAWLKEEFELYKNVPGEIIFKAQRIRDEGIDPDIPDEGDAQMGVEDDPNFNADIPQLQMEPFGQRFIGIVDTYPALSVEIVNHAKEHIDVEQHRESVIVTLKAGNWADGIVSCLDTWKPTSLPAEYAFVLWQKLRDALFGSDPYSEFTSKP